MVNGSPYQSDNNAQLQVAILGEFIENRPPRQSIAPAIEHAANAIGLAVTISWLNDRQAANQDRTNFDALLVAPGSPDEATNNILAFIRHAREQQVPCLGTCGGMQRMATEYALNVLGFEQVEHAELAPDAVSPLFTGLSCQITGITSSVLLRPNTTVSECYEGSAAVDEVFYCRFGMNPMHVPVFEQSGFQVVGYDKDGTARIISLAYHPFFVGTLFVPQISSTAHKPHPLLSGLLKASHARAIQSKRHKTVLS